jgi:hypothetical protein
MRSGEDYTTISFSPDISRMIKSRRMRWAGHVARVGGEHTCIQALQENLKGEVHFEHLSVDERIILKLSLNE